MDQIDYTIDDRPVVEDATLIEWEGELKDKPEIEQKLYHLQEAWYNKDSTDEQKRAIWMEMFGHVQLYARSMVLQKMKNKKFLSPDIIDDYASESSLRFMSQYLYRRNFKCGTSFGKMINYKVLEAVYGNKEDDKTVSLSQESDDTEIDLLNLSQKVGMSQFLTQEAEDPSDMLMKETFEDLVDEVFRELDSEIDDSIIKLKCRMFINLVFKKPKNRHVKAQFIKKCCHTKKEIDVINLLELEFKERLKKKLSIN